MKTLCRFSAGCLPSFRFAPDFGATVCTPIPKNQFVGENEWRVKQCAPHLQLLHHRDSLRLAAFAAAV